MDEDEALEAPRLSTESKLAHALLLRELGYGDCLNCFESILLARYDGRLPAREPELGWRK